MGAVCYKPKPATITQADILRALNDKHLKATITKPDGVKTLKTDEQYSNNLLTFGTITQMFNYETTHETTTHNNTLTNTNTMNASINQRPPGKSKLKNISINPNVGGLGQLELNILTYFGDKDQIYDTLTHLSRKSLYFMKRNYKKIENHPKLRNANEKIKFGVQKSIEEHSSGVNQLIKLNNKELVSASDDCFMKFWTAPNMKVESSIPTETITCICQTGNSNPKQKDIIVAGCHSGNLLIISVSQRAKKEQVNNAHYNLIRVIVTLEALKNKYFVSADVCGIVKVWTSQLKPQQVMEIQQEGAISYNSMIEIEDMLPKRSSYEDTAVIACALKNQRINLILLMPSSGTYQLIKTLKTQQKPTCLIQLTTKHIAIAVGQLKENSTIEVHDVNKSKLTAQLRVHKDMIDSMLKLGFPPEKLKSSNQYVTWFLSASRDRQIVLWKLIDGKIMRRNIIINNNNTSNNLILSANQTPFATTQGGTKQFSQSLIQQQQQQQQNRNSQNNKISNSNRQQNSKQQKQNRQQQQKKRQRQSEDDDNEDNEDQEEEDDYDQEEEEYQRSQDNQDDSDGEMIAQQKQLSIQEESKFDDRNGMMSEVSNINFKSDVEGLNSPAFKLKQQSQQNQIIQQIQQQQLQIIQQDHYLSFESGHKDFIRSMAQINNGNMLVTASEDKLIKVFTINF